MENPVSAAFAVEKVSGTFSSFALSKAGKWLLVGLSVVLATAVTIPLLRKIPFLANLGSGAGIVAGLSLAAAAITLAYFARNVPLVPYLAMGLGVAGMITVSSSLYGWVRGFGSSASKQLAEAV